MRRTVLALSIMLLGATGTLAPAQVLRMPVLRGQRGMPPPPPSIEIMQADMVAKSGSDTVYFAGSGYGIDAPAQATLTAQARWLRANPAVRARIEGHADERTPRDFALAHINSSARCASAGWPSTGYVISSAPITELTNAIKPTPISLFSARALRYRRLFAAQVVYWF